ncbi:T9SS type A sorting domain-containing protein [Niastella populi]|uniref:Secretion system C-terminal sorting domain-containing protein n=1 Tax=Niastella populi TaxID=550983 RepID=A0A1V9FX67_9BACT|nr:T9SS type A sorting domain-containing protein [Niastella populi]OQP62933.1 hypothetical protein A4R26_17275 [Niastella populi]
MKKVTSTLTTLLICLYVSAQVGVPDGGFNTTGTVINPLNAADDYGQAVATYSDGRVVVAAYNTDKWFTFLRYMPDGTLDPNFGTGGLVKVRNSNDDAIAYAITVLSDNSLLAAGYAWNPTNSTFDMALVKLDENGAPITTFGPQGNGWILTPVGTARDEARSIAVQSDGKIVLAGYINNGTDNDYAVVRYTSNGILETGVGAFGGGTGKVTTHINGDDEAYSVAIQSADQKIVVGGITNASATNSNIGVVRYNTDGTLDAAPGNFGTGGIVDLDLGNNGAGSTDEVYKIALQADGKIVMAGMSKGVSFSNYDFATIRLTTTGALDPAFNATGAIVNRAGGFTAAGIALFNYGPSNTDEGSRTLALQSNGDILVGGDSQGGSSTFAFLLLRYNSDGTLDDTFDGSSNSNGVIFYDISGNRDYGYDIALFGNRIYFTGSTGENGSKDLALIAIQNDGAPLPLVLSQFYAQKQSSKVVLQWQTSSEEGVKQFVIERSNDGKSFKAIGTVAATGNSTITRKYSFADNSPFISASNYYRLLMQDADGNFKYSKMLIIKFDGQLSTDMKVYPSMVKDILQVQLPDGMNGNIGIRIIDMNGRVIRKNNIAGDGHALNTTMDVSTLIKGVYIIKATAGNVSVTSRFTKQ